MIRPATRRRDAIIIELRRRGMIAKEIKMILGLTNVWLVYDAVKRRNAEFPKKSCGRTL